MATASLRALLQAGPVLGTFQVIGHPSVTEVLARVGVQVIVPDAEHAALDLADLEHLVRAGQAAGAHVVLRLPRADVGLSRALDTGASGVIVPRVESAADAAQIVRYTRFPPVGERGLGAGRATAYALDLATHRSTANDALLVVAMVETRAGLQAVDEIVAVDGIDVIMVGPADLASSLGVDAGGPEHSAAVERVMSAALAAGRTVGIHCASVDDARRYHELGVDFLLIATDVAFLASAASPHFPTQLR
ncbi:HpcH/HpaI aldolase/citrate lyase family protein [Cryobacterium sp. BB736]|nr:aldolase/citrate lyase family protein [Cryobacterium sp. BB736]